jgi:hypothetical protein
MSVYDLTTFNKSKKGFPLLGEDRICQQKSAYIWREKPPAPERALPVAAKGKNTYF